MDSSKQNDWMQVIGIFALVLSLIFVGRQIQQSHEIALAEQYQARADAAQNLYLTLYEGGYSMFDSRQIPLMEQAPRQRDGTVATVLWGWTQYDNHYYQYTAGFLDDEAWIGLKYRIQELYDKCDQRIGWVDTKRFYRPSFVEYVESLEDRCIPTQ